MHNWQSKHSKLHTAYFLKGEGQAFNQTKVQCLNKLVRPKLSKDLVEGVLERIK